MKIYCVVVIEMENDFLMWNCFLYFYFIKFIFFIELEVGN